MKHLARLAALVCGLGVVFSSPSGVSAHSELVSSIPADGDQVASLEHVVLVFSETLDPSLVRIDLAGPAGERVATELSSAEATRIAFAPVSSLPDGVWVASWSALSPDGHVVDGVFSFTVSAPTPTPVGSPTASSVVREVTSPPVAIAPAQDVDLPVGNAASAPSEASIAPPAVASPQAAATSPEVAGESDAALWVGAVVIVLISAAGGAALLAFARKVASEV